MKLFSRKSLVAGATAIAVSFAGVNVATAEETTPVTTTTQASKDDKVQDNKDENEGSGSSISDLSSNEDGTEKTSEEIAKEAKAWIGVVSAVIGVLGSIFAFISKYIDIPGQK